MGQIQQTTYGSDSAGDPYIPTSGNGGYSAEHYELTVDYRVATNRLNATATITARAVKVFP